MRARSVIDVGCGIGTWLQAFAKNGVERLQGVDGAYVKREQLLIPKKSFLAHDLTQPLPSFAQFDLAMSVEVAEHLPADCAAQFVDSLCALAPAVLFSAAVPFQGGDDHINEQWPEYWAALFARRDYVVYDCIRPLVWNNADVAYYYAQNIFVYVKRSAIADYLALNAHQPATGPLARIHPRRWLEANDAKRQRLPPLLRALPYSVSNAIKRRIGFR